MLKYLYLYKTRFQIFIFYNMKKYIIAGCIGGFLVFIFLLMALIIFGAYDYAPVQILNPTKINHCLENDKIALIQELTKNGTLLSPSEYTSHIISYYNSIIMLLVGLFVIFSFIGYFSLKSKMKEQIQESLIEMLRDSKEFDKTISENIMGRVTNEFVPNEIFEEMNAEIAMLKEKLVKMEESPVKKNIRVSKK